MKKNKNLLDMTASLLKEGSPDLRESLEGLSPVYAKIIFARRIQCGYTQEQLASKAKTGLKTISRAEGGFDNLSTATYDKIFNALNLSIKDIAEAMIQLQANNDELAATSR
ncbi:helix-turn-helix domain-containing protein [Oceanobacillus oncorhynchi]|uniref:helix-turn-helix domain-containing protein n=1 Tax=Oceanobacillus oncorhynchi TaxID=545501 RepID=UPI0034D57DC5